MFWKTYFWVILFFWLIVLVFFSGYNPYGGFQIWHIADMTVTLLGCVGLYGFAWKRLILTKQFWQMFFPLCILWSLAFHYITPPVDHLEWANTIGLAPAILATVDIAPFLPMIVALFLYSYVSYDLWGEVEKVPEGDFKPSE